MRLSDLEKRVFDLERRTPKSDELGLVIGAMNRAHCSSLGQPFRANMLDAELNRLAALDSLPDGTSKLVMIAWELLRDAEVQPCD